MLWAELLVLQGHTYSNIWSRQLYVVGFRGTQGHLCDKSHIMVSLFFPDLYSCAK